LLILSLDQMILYTGFGLVIGFIGLLQIVITACHVGPRDVALGRTQQKTPLPTIPLSLQHVAIGADPKKTPLPAVPLLVNLRGVTYSIAASLFITSWPSKGRFFWLNYSRFQRPCHTWAIVYIGWRFGINLTGTVFLAWVRYCRYYRRHMSISFPKSAFCFTFHHESNESVAHIHCCQTLQSLLMQEICVEETYLPVSLDKHLVGFFQKYSVKICITVQIN
jgi:hypothetical protein